MTTAFRAYNGQLHEAETRWQVLGNGHRIYNPALMRFHSPDRQSPFQRGGTNAYAYCSNDPVNFTDPSGQFLLPIAALMTIGSVAMFAAAGASWSKGKRDAGNIFAAIGAALGAAGLVAGGLRLAMHHQRPLKMGAMRIKKGRHVDTVDVHGKPNRTIVGSEALDGTQMAQLLESKGIGKRPVNFLSCGSADGDASQIKVLANYFEKPFTGYEGLVKVNDFTMKPIGNYRAVVAYPEPRSLRALTAQRNAFLNRQSKQRAVQTSLRIRGR